tara:strand:+ start:2205 stop:2390 length:186 start_codon:yes stop_codon:yes gene_type:complete
METFTLAEMGVFIGVLGGVATSLILTFQKSKCKKIKLCGCECDREIKTPEEVQADDEATNP